MRSEQQMYDLILGYAKDDDRVRAVYLNGSRANPNAKRDIFQDYDVVYVVTSTGDFIADENWTSVFGELIIKQEPDKLDKMRGINVDYDKSYTYLMQFADGNRIDLHIQTIEAMLSEYGKDKLTVALLDKDGCLPHIPKPTDEDYWVKKPTYAEFYSVCNNFWWVAPYCAKGLWREEILYAAETLNAYVREDLLQMLAWYAGTTTGFSVSVGKGYKLLKQYLNDDIWGRLLSTYNTSDYRFAWCSLIVACSLFFDMEQAVGKSLRYEYNKSEAEKSFDFILHIKELPKTAAEIY